MALVLAPGIAHADRGGGASQGGGTSETSGGREGAGLVSKVVYRGSTSGSRGSDGRGALQPVGDWTPPACWYEPRSAEQFRDYVESVYEETVNTPGQHSYAKQSVGMFREDYKDGTYKNYNLDKKDEGSFWVAVRDEDRRMEPEAQACDKMPFWVENGDPVPVENAVTPEVLAELAYNRVRLPAAEVTLRPEAATKVNLPTWAWLDKATFKETSVTASIAVGGLNIQATTTARPVSLRLEPGTPDAETYPASGECTIDADGSIGEPYTRGQAERTPPCGLKYLRSSGDGTFTLRATITWEIAWTGTGGAGGDLPDGTFGNDQAVTVQEIQSVNR
ncbi:hypothetical protein ACH4UX_22230 [Streptomyces althioticus]|uniref:hypothetical protein n=1 Tax=Streptomyces althioticus TaxID=83380 RepID=UPI000524121B|nr:hypothetical protein [Actinospica acidiphila]WTC23736.1 hypothetical protein OG872_14095 [Streptomyces althioticus]